MKKYQIFFWSILFFVISTAVFTASDFIYSKYAIFFFGAVMVFAISLLVHKCWLWFFVVVSVSVASINVFIRRPAESVLVNSVDQNVEFVARVLEDQTRTAKQKLVVEAVEFDSEKILLYLSVFPEYSVGEELKINGRISLPYVSEDGDFDYSKYLARQEIYTVMYDPEVELLSSKTKGDFRGKFSESLDKIFHEPEASLIKRLTVGDKRKSSEYLIEDFRRSGVMHLVAISGMHVAIIASILVSMLKFLFPKTRALVVFACLISFLFFSGTTASVFRAVIMGVLVLVAGVSGRIVYLRNLILFAASLMLFFDPMLLLFDVGFQLSFIATVGILYFSPKIQQKIKFIPDLWGFKESVVVSFSAQILTVPLALYYFGYFSPIYIIASFVMTPLLPYLLGGGLFTGFIGILSDKMGSFFSAILSVPARLEIFLAHFFSQKSIIFNAKVSLVWILAFYSLIILIYIYFKNYASNRNNTT